MMQGKSLNIFSSDNRFRLRCAKTVCLWQFEYFINVLILTVSVLVIMESPFWDPESLKWRLLMLLGEIIQVLFIIELLIRIIAVGAIWNGKQSYLLNGWRLVDAIVILMSTAIFLRYIIEDQQSPIDFSILQVLRGIRIIRIIMRNEGMKAALLSIIRAFPNIIRLILVCSIFFIIFAIFGIQFKRGTFYHCEKSNIQDKNLQDLIFNKWDCLDYGGNWVNSDRTFDTFGSALVLLFELATAEGWMDIM